MHLQKFSWLWLILSALLLSSCASYNQNDHLYYQKKKKKKKKNCNTCPTFSSLQTNDNKTLVLTTEEYLQLVAITQPKN